jgi:putative ABC transport system permease protein
MTITFRQPGQRAALHEIAQLPGVLRVEGLRAVPARIQSGHRSRKIPILGLDESSELRRVLHADGRAVTLPAEGLVLTTWLAEHLQVGVGDTIRVEPLEGSREVRTTRVAALVDELFGLSAYMRSDALHRLLREEESVSAALVAVDPRRSRATHQALKTLPGVAGVTERSAVLASFESMTGAWMALVSTILSLFAATIAFGVVYNTARINLAERERELASLRVLGFTVREITTILASELGAIIALGIPVGYVVARGIVEIVMRSGNVEGYRFPRAFEPHTLATAALVVACAGLLSGLSLRRKLHHLDLVGVLKTRD